MLVWSYCRNIHLSWCCIIMLVRVEISTRWCFATSIKLGGGRRMRKKENKTENHNTPTHKPPQKQTKNPNKTQQSQQNRQTNKTTTKHTHKKDSVFCEWVWICVLSHLKGRVTGNDNDIMQQWHNVVLWWSEDCEKHLKSLDNRRNHAAASLVYCYDIFSQILLWHIELVSSGWHWRW